MLTKPFKRDKIKQEPFHAHFEETRRASRDDWEVRLIELTDNVENFQKTVSFLQQKWYTFQPNGLNVQEVALFQHLYPILLKKIQPNCLFKKVLLCILLNEVLCTLMN